MSDTTIRITYGDFGEKVLELTPAEADQVYNKLSSRHMWFSPNEVHEAMGIAGSWWTVDQPPEITEAVYDNIDKLC